MEHAGVMVPGKESAQTLQEPEENLLEESKSDRDFAEDMDLQMDKIPEERIAVTAERSLKALRRFVEETYR